MRAPQTREGQPAAEHPETATLCADEHSSPFLAPAAPLLQAACDMTATGKWTIIKAVNGGTLMGNILPPETSCISIDRGVVRIIPLGLSGVRLRPAAVWSGDTGQQSVDIAAVELSDSRLAEEVSPEANVGFDVPGQEPGTYGLGAGVNCNLWLGGLEANACGNPWTQ